ncbi:MAG: RHS repeat-associated core domain-containing protein, partial [Actinobacteria bacterium]|nr:RHS repeat-associated core domain-containing protein [Actinomycetota bacterium]
TTDPLNNILEFNYDPAGNLSKTIYPNGNETYYSYYDDNLLNTVTYKNEPTSYTYTYNPTHTLNTVTDNNGKVNSYQYDNGNRLILANDENNSSIIGGFTITRGYDGVSNLTSLSYGSTNLAYGYNDRDDLTSLSVNGQPSTVFAYDDAKNRTDVNTPDSSNRHYTYNDANRITQVKNTTISGIQTFDYTHDGNGNILTENTTNYGYDSLNRLLSWNQGGINTTYQYDDTGNLLQVAENGVPAKTFTYNAANQITNSGFTYDANGNMTSDGTYTYIYDGENRLKEVKQGANTIASYTYDYMGRRISATEGGSITYFHYDDWNVVAETNSTGSTVATYTYDNRNQLVSMTGGGQTYYYQYNAHGDVVSLTNSAGQVVNTYEYDPWGKVLSTSETVANPYRYAGYRYDESTELYYLQTRYYKPDIYRFLTKDTHLGNQMSPQSLNPYSYCQNNPVNLIDSEGEVPVPLPIITGAVGAIASAGGYLAATALSGEEVNIKDLAVAAGTGFAAGVLAPTYGTTVGGAMILSAIANVAQYGIGNTVNNRESTLVGYGVNIATGLVAGRYIAGAFSSKAFTAFGEFAPALRTEIMRPLVWDAVRSGGWQFGRTFASYFVTNMASRLYEENMVEASVLCEVN